MNIRDALLAEHSKTNTLSIAAYVGTDPERFAQLFQLFSDESEGYRLTQRGVWVVTHCVEAEPSLIEPYLAQMLEMLRSKKHHPSIGRNFFKVLAEITLSESHQGTAIDLSFDYLLDPKQPVATKVHAMQLCWNIAEGIPELEEELRAVLEEQYEAGSAGFKSRAGKILEAIKG